MKRLRIDRRITSTSCCIDVKGVARDILIELVEENIEYMRHIHRVSDMQDMKNEMKESKGCS